MIDIRQFEHIKQKHGGYASWAVWAEGSTRPKSNMGDISHFNSEGVLRLLKNNVVMVGLNVSRPPCGAFANFHDPDPRANDFKIRYAFKDSEYYGAYMTDIVKCFVKVESKNVMRFLREHPAIIGENMRTFREEMLDLKATAPIILAFGRDTHTILKDNLKDNEFSKLIRLPHYSQRISKEAYKETVAKALARRRLLEEIQRGG